MSPTITVEQLNKQELLRVLNFQYNVGSVAELYRNVNLRYLAFRYDKSSVLQPHFSVWKLPSSAFFVWNLQTLIIEGDFYYSSIVGASKKFWKMRQLRHVECREIYIPRWKEGDEMLILENLRTLKTVLDMSISEEVCQRIPNIKKLGLRYRGLEDCMIENLCNLGRLDKLESLKLEITSAIPQLNEKLRFPSSLNKLCPWDCLLEWKDLTVMVGSLPQLQVLMLEDKSVRGRKWSPVYGQFLHLKFLKINARGLMHWDADQSHFPVLEKLVLCHMDRLKGIPQGIGDIPTHSCRALQRVGRHFSNKNKGSSAREWE